MNNEQRGVFAHKAVNLQAPQRYTCGTQRLRPRRNPAAILTASSSLLLLLLLLLRFVAVVVVGPVIM